MSTSRTRTLSLSCLGLLALLGLTAALLRDLPRRLVAEALADRLAARVSLERLAIDGREDFRLLGLQIEDLRDYPFVESLRIEELLVTGSLEGLRESRFARWQLRGVSVHLAPATWTAPPPRPWPTIGELIVEPAAIRVAAAPGGAAEARGIVAAKLSVVAQRLAGEVRLDAEALPTAPIIALAAPASPPPMAGRLEELEATLHLAAESPILEARASRFSASRQRARLDLAEPRLRVEIGDPSTAIALRATSARLDLAGRPFLVDAPRLEATVEARDEGHVRIELRPHLAGLAAAQLSGDWDPQARRLRRLAGRLTGVDLGRLLPDSGLEATADVELEGSGESLDYAVEIDPVRIQATPERTFVAPAGSTLRLAGSLPFAPLATLQAPTWEGPIEIAVDLPAGPGSWGGVPLPPSLLPSALRTEGRLQAAGGWRWSGESRLVTASGGHLEVTGGLSRTGDATHADLRWTWRDARLESLAELGRQAGLATPPLALSGAAAATGTLSGPLLRPVIQATLELHDLDVGELAGTAWRLTDATATTRWSWCGADAPIRLLAIDGSGQLATPDFGPLPVTLTAAGSGTPDLSRGRVESARLGFPGLGLVRLAGRWQRRSPGTTATGTLLVEDVDLGRWQKLLAPGGPEPAAGSAALEWTGIADARLEANLESTGKWRLAGPLQATAGFASADGSRVMEGLAGHWQVAARGGGADPTEIEASGRAGGFLLLWNTFFGDFSSLDLELATSARFPPAGEDASRPWRMRTRIRVPDGPAAELDLSSASGTSGWLYSLALDDADLGRTYRRHLASLLEERLGRLDLGGELELSARGHYRPLEEGRATWDLTGRLRLDDFGWRSGGGQGVVAGLRLDLPLDLRRRPTTEVDFSGPRLAGQLAFERLAIRGLELPATETDLIVEADAVGLEQPIALEILGGALTLEQLTLSRMLRSDRHLEAGIRLADLRLEQISEALELFPLEGALNGYLPSARLAADTLHIEGGGQIEIFGGIVRVHDISGEDVLTRFPKLELSADFEAVDLGQLTRRIDFGEMTGTLQGSLTECELFRGVPVRFAARLETVASPGVPRTVDVKAVNNITILGTGQRSNIFDRGIQRFFKKYTYERLGVDLRLRHDVLLLRGLERRGRRELFLRGRLPFRIDVVNAQPGKTVSFQAMMQRLRNLDFARATTGAPTSADR